MENKKIKSGINEIRQIKMTTKEKEEMLQSVLNDPLISKQSVRSRWTSYAFFVKLKKYNKAISYALIPLIFIFAGGAVAFASQDSLPDSILYPIKTKVVEPISGAIKLTQEAKARHESKLAVERLKEAEVLANEGRLDKNKEDKLNDLLSAHTSSFTKALDKINETGSKKNVDEIVTNFKAEMNAHAKILDIISKDSNKEIKNSVIKEIIREKNKNDNLNEDETSKIDNEIKKYKNKNQLEIEDNKENSFMNNRKKEESDNNEKNDDNYDLENSKLRISKTARSSAGEFENESESSSESIVDEEIYSKRKEVVKNLIEKVDKDLDNSPVMHSNKDKKIIDDTYQTLEKARSYLKEADQKKEEGDSGKAYSNLLNSESSVREADIFLKNGLRFSENQKERDD